MNFDYHGIGSTGSRRIPVQAIELATNIITDWMPGAPNSLSRGFVDLLDNVVASHFIDGNHYWTLQPTAAHFEKQWKQVISWILGVAFCKKVVDIEGYTWIAPLSAFSSQNTYLLSRWAPIIPFVNSTIKPDPSISATLMPDYVLARAGSGNPPLEISFAESKATKNCLENCSMPPDSWINQARNARFYFRNKVIPATQKMLIATRVNPKARKAKTRRVYVRCWNSKKESLGVSIEGFRDILLLHYFGVCERLGMTANAKLLALRSYRNVDMDQKGQMVFLKNDPQEYEKGILDDAREEIDIHSTNRLHDFPVSIARNRADFQIGHRLVRVGLSQPGMDVVRWLQKGENIAGLEQIVEQLQNGFSDINPNLENAKDIFIRRDGVFAEFIR
jgi:hypothetical protein